MKIGRQLHAFDFRQTKLVIKFLGLMSLLCIAMIFEQSGKAKGVSGETFLFAILAPLGFLGSLFATYKIVIGDAGMHAKAVFGGRDIPWSMVTKVTLAPARRGLALTIITPNRFPITLESSEIGLDKCREVGEVVIQCAGLAVKRGVGDAFEGYRPD